MSDIAPFADGSERHLPDKPIKGQGVNLDHDEVIFQNTEKSGGKWRYYNIEGKLIAETDAPSEINGNIISQWADAVRSRTKREHNLTRERDRVSDGGIALPEGVDAESVRAADDAVDSDVRNDAPAPSVDDDPDGYVSSKIKDAGRKLQAIRVKVAELQEQVTELEEEGAAAQKELEKWKRMQEAINAES